MELGFLFWSAGLLFIWLEFYLPGGVLGFMALIALLGAIATWAQLPWGWWQWTVALGSMVSSVVGISLLALKTLKRGAAIVGTSEQGHAAEFRGDLVGCTAIAIGDLSPSGYVLIDKKRYAAISQMGPILSGASVIVSSGEGFSLYVVPK